VKAVPGSVSPNADTRSITACAICGGMRTRRLYTKSGHDIGRCVSCGLVYANPRAPRDTVLARYNSDYFWKEYLPALGVMEGDYDLNQFDVRYAPLLGLLGPASGRRLLEIGCGAGFFLKVAERNGWRVTGIELSEEASRFGIERLGLDIRREPAETLNVPAATFDAVVMFDTIEHLFDPRVVLKSVARALVPAGQLLISTPNFRALSRQLLGSSWAVLSPLEHMYYFEEKTLGRLVEDCGFSGMQFIRTHAAWSAQETMNFMHTHEPRGLRARATAVIARTGGQFVGRAVQRAGWQDILICLATQGILDRL
jgi:2-polyprenyl-3-methyl-5-hydroxy-6-metoxy-1,4-benzoquinol methylase